MRVAVIWALRVALAMVFVIAGVLKLKDPAAFATEITNYRLLPELAPYLAIALPPIEIAAGLGLLVLPEVWRRASALAIVGLLIPFTIAVASVTVRGIDVSCGCFGASASSVTWVTVLRDVVLLAIAMTLVAVRQNHVIPSEARDPL